ncbi:hypothetical protein GGX14DRAFT_389583 [Mycena pura]|uniref:Uncharacterized protein n=1 Tax=Mycena pura TaxID=153505 RepID=A0AAD6VUJ1_9AGAR|nr:hypothetical protein GGX14DRAFT_389583 [Mycena pura]
MAAQLSVPRGASGRTLSRRRVAAMGRHQHWGRGEHTSYTAPRKSSESPGSAAGRVAAMGRRQHSIWPGREGTYPCYRCSQDLAAHRGRSRRYTVHVIHESAASARRRGKACVLAGDARTTTAQATRRRQALTVQRGQRSRAVRLEHMGEGGLWSNDSWRRDALAPFSGLFKKGARTARLCSDGKRLEDADRRATAAGVSRNGSSTIP